MSKAKFAEPILESIDQLRSHKARPDLARICHMVERRHGLGADDVQSSLAIMVDENLVIKVNYKGNISYRNPAKWKRRRRDLTEERRPAAVVRAKLPTKKKLLKLKAAKALVKTKRKRGRPPLNKAKIKRVVKIDEDIEETVDESVVENAPEDVKDVASRPAEAGSHKKAKGDSESITDLSADERTSSRSSKAYIGRQKARVKYELVKGRKSSGKAGLDIHGSVKVSGAESDHTASETESPNDAASNDVEDANAASENSLVGSKKIKLIMSKKKLESRRLSGRPRKCLKLKKSISQDSQSHPPTKKTCHEVSMKTDAKMNPLVAGTGDQDPRCDFCVRTAASNRNGQPEELLICRDCQAKAHPSCMDYSDELAQRACRSPWQCIDCKTCNICNDSGDADAMLFCDACDKGYHMNCHQPPVEAKPKGKWVCCQCILEFGGSDDPIGSGENNPENNVDLPVEENISPAGEDGGGASCLPTPNDSPVHFSEEVEESKMSSRLSPSIIVPLPRLATTLTAEVPDASSWSIVDVVKFFSDMGFTEQCEAFREQEIDGRALLLMTRMDVITGLSLRLGAALKIYVHIQRLQRKHSNSH